MTRAPILPRLLARPATLWNLLVASVLSTALARSAWSVQTLRDGVDVDAETAAAFIGVLVASAGLGGIAAWSSFEAALCTFSATLPGLRERLRTEILVAGAACALLAAVAGELLSVDPVACASLAALGFGFAVFASDPRTLRATGSGWLCFAVLAALALGAPAIAAWSGAQPMLGLLVAVAVAAFLAALPFRPGRQRARSITPTAEIGMTYQATDVRAGAWGTPPRATGSGAPHWRARLASDRDWVRAALHEVHGFNSGGWIAQAAGTGLFLCLMVLAYEGYVGWDSTKGADGLIDTLQRSLEAGGEARRRGFTAFNLAVWLGMGLVVTPFVPLSTVLRPLSRARRARIAWKASVVWVLTALASLSVAFAVATEVLRQLCDAPTTSATLPTWAHAVIVLAILWPIVTWARLCFLDSSAERPGPVRQGVVAGGALIALGAAAWLLAYAWFHAAGTPVTFQIGAAALLFASAQWIWRTLLDQHFQRADLRA